MSMVRDVSKIPVDILNTSDTRITIRYVAFNSKKCCKERGERWLLTIAKYKDKSYKEMPSYEVVGKWKRAIYVALYPTDVQFEIKIKDSF